MWLLHLEKIRRKTVCLMWCGKCSLKMHKTLYLAIFLYSEKFISCMFYCTPEAVPSILCSIWQTTGCHTLSYTVISVWIQSTCQNCFGFFLVFFFMSAYLRLYGCLMAADCATIQRRELWPEVWRQTGSLVFVGTSYWWVWKLKRQDKECAWLDAEWLKKRGGDSLVICTDILA